MIQMLYFRWKSLIFVINITQSHAESHLFHYFQNVEMHCGFCFFWIINFQNEQDNEFEMAGVGAVKVVLVVLVVGGFCQREWQML